MASRPVVLTQLAVMTLGSFLAALASSLAVTIVGAVLMGLMLAPLGTYFALALDTLAPPQKRPEVFALLRTAVTVGIFASALLTAIALPSALIVVAGTMLAVTLVVLRAPADPNASL